MRKDVKKVLFVGYHTKKDQFFKKAQEIGVIEFIGTSASNNKDLPTEIENTIVAIKVLRGLPTMEQEKLEHLSDADGIIAKVIETKRSLEKLLEEERIMKLEIARIAVFGHFSLDDVSFIQQKGNRVVQYFFAKHGHFNEENTPEGFIPVASEHGLDYFIAIHKESVEYPHMSEMKIDHSLSSLQEQLKTIQREIDSREKELKSLEKYHSFLHQALVAKMDKHHLTSAKNGVINKLDGSLFAVMGWVPEDKMAALTPLLESLDISHDEICIEPEDSIPTYLENESFGRIGEDLVHIYDAPSYTDNDPSLWVLFFFALFFAFIVNDGGYGLVFLGIALYLKYKMSDAKPTGKRLLKLFSILTGACILWGVLTNSFFGIDFAQDSPFRKVSVLNWLAHKKADYHLAHQDETFKEIAKKFPEAEQATKAEDLMNLAKIEPGEIPKFEIQSKFYDNIMMELALLVGCIHITLSFLRYLNRNWAAVGWVTFIWGCYLYFPVYLKTTSIFNYLFGVSKAFGEHEGLLMIYAGLALATIVALIQKRWSGLLEITNVIGVFSDILSYLRLYALGLAGAIMGATINEIAGGIDVILGALLLIIGHAFNIVLAIMGGVIHWLRLNFLEWYHYCFEGGGKMFKPLKKLENES